LQPFFVVLEWQYPVITPMRKFIEQWKRAWRVRSFREQLVVTVPVLLISLVALRIFLEYIEHRSGVMIADPVLELLPVIDLTWITFALLCSGLVLGIATLCFRPYALVRTLRAFVVMTLLRIVYISFLPLDPPPEAIPLVDPFVQVLGSGVVLTRDLFFSGHTATMVLLALAVPWRDLKIVLSIGALAIAICDILQHVHYVIDVLTAPCFAYAAHGIAEWLTVKEPEPPKTLPSPSNRMM